jgi:hypothetical protein
MAVSASGVAGDPAPAVTFRVDSIPPVVNLSPNVETSKGGIGLVCVAFTAVDHNASVCAAGNASNVPGGDFDVDSDGDGFGCGVSCRVAGEHDWKPCTSPACYASEPRAADPSTADTTAAAAVLPAGALGWCSAAALTLEVVAVDAAGNRAEASMQVPCAAAGGGKAWRIMLDTSLSHRHSFSTLLSSIKRLHMTWRAVSPRP